MAGTARDIVMKGGGYYSRATLGAKYVIDGATPLILNSLEDMGPPDDGSIFTMSDMGCADAGTSMTMVGTVLKEVRRRAPSRPIQMVYTDLPRNDFSQLFRNVLGLGEIASYFEEIDNLHVFASGTSFHRRILPPGALHLGFSATASHYLSERPARIENHVHMVGATGAERDAFTEQGRRDWEAMLLHRACELAPGGRLALFNFGIDEEGRYLGNTGGIGMFDTFNELWAELRDEGSITTFNELWAELRDEGSITPEEYVDTSFPQHYRTVEEFTRPFREPDSPVHRAGLRLDHAETRVVRCPFAAHFEEHRDPARFAREYIPTLRSWSESTFASGLSPDRPPADRAAILDRLYDRYEARVREAPDGHAMDYVHCYLIASKVRG